MKTLCLLLDINDADWFSGFLANRTDETEFIVAAPTLEGRLIASSLNVSYNSYEQIAWSINTNALDDDARRKAHQWHTLPDVLSHPALQAVSLFNGYPVLSMHESKLVLSLFEVLFAFEFISRIINLEKPDTILFGERTNPFSRHFLLMATGTGGGLEREAVKAIRNIKSESADQFLAKLTSFVPDQELAAAPISVIQTAEVLPGASSSKRLLLFHYGGYYYLDFIEETLDLLSKKGVSIVVVNIGSALTQHEEVFFRRLNICCLDKSEWAVPNEKSIREQWRKQAVSAAQALGTIETLGSYFATESGSYFEGLAKDALCVELMHTEQTIIELLRTESIIRTLKPDAVINHFAHHPEETCFVLPARRLGIPTVSMLHGFNWYNIAVNNTFATNRFAVTGKAFQDAILQAVNCSEVDVPVVGTLRTPRVVSHPVDATKRALGLDPDAPLCIFCDNSVTPYNHEFRHKTIRVISELLALKEVFPRIQIIYRVHHGGDYSVLRAYVEQYREQGLFFQTSLEVPLLNIAPAAHVIISNASSVISESLLCGTPVIYLCALAVHDPMFSGYDTIRIATSYDMLSVHVRELLAANYSHEEVKTMSQPFFDRTLAGNDGKAHERFAALIINMVSIPQTEWKPGFQDWLDRLEAASTFSSQHFNTLEPFDTSRHKNSPARPFVSVIMPAYNRAHMIGITLESFVNQDYPKDRYEIIVSDNNSTDATRAVVQEWQKKSPVPVTYIFEGRQGVHYARNTAAKQSRGDILYYTDDDMIAEPDLLTEMVKVFELDPMVGTATGRVLPKWEVPPPEWIMQLCYNGWLSLFDELGDGMRVEDHDLGVYSCHQAIRRDVFFKSGGYNPESTYTDYIGDGETGLNIKIKALGYKFGYNGKSVIYHMIPPARLTQDYLNKRLANQGSADSYTEYRRHRYAIETLSERVRSYLNSLTEHSMQSLTRRKAGDVRWRMDKAYTHYYLNRIEYDLRLMDDEAWREMVLKDNWLEE